MPRGEHSPAGLRPAPLCMLGAVVSAEGGRTAQWGGGRPPDGWVEAKRGVGLGGGAEGRAAGSLWEAVTAEHSPPRPALGGPSRRAAPAARRSAASRWVLSAGAFPAVASASGSLSGRAIFILILYRGGPSNVLRGFLDSRQVLDYSKTHDVYTNLSLFTQAPDEEAMPYCSAQSPIFVGPLTITFRVLPSEKMIIKKNPFVQSGGRYRPPHCLARYKSAILVAYKNQEKYLRHLLYYIHPFLQRQQLSYSIYLIQQVGNGTFNRAKLLNVGVREALKDEDWDCLLLHDVDLVPENDYNLYVCDEYYPKHMASAMDKFQYTLPYKSFFGGVSALTPEHYMKMNGFPNTYWGSGGENDDIATRIQLAGMKIVRTSPHLGRYKVMDYNEETETQEPWRRPTSRHNTRKTWKDDGMNSLEFKLLSRTKHPLYTNITVDIGYVPPFS